MTTRAVSALIRQAPFRISILRSFVLSITEKAVKILPLWRESPGFCQHYEGNAPECHARRNCFPSKMASALWSVDSSFGLSPCLLYFLQFLGITYLCLLHTNPVFYCPCRASNKNA